MRYWVSIFLVVGALAPAFAQANEIVLRPQWLVYDDGAYRPLENVADAGNTIYLRLAASDYSPGRLAVSSVRRYFLFFNGKLAGDFIGTVTLDVDSLFAGFSMPLLVTIHQRNINPRDLTTSVRVTGRQAAAAPDNSKPETFFRDFAALAGLILILIFLLLARFNTKLAADYFSIVRIFSTREADDAQSNARLTSSANIQFYAACSLLVGFYLLIVFQHLPDPYALPLRFKVNGFWSAVGQWLKLSAFAMAVFMLKILLIFALTRLYGMRGLTRVHFFNWMRLMIVVLGAAAVIVFVYFILRGHNSEIFEGFLVLITTVLAAWMFIIFLKLNGKSEHSMFHLFSYICATELIPLLITIKVLFE